MFEKRWWMVIFFAALVVAVSACNNDDNNEVFAPSSAANQTYQLTLTNATGIWASGMGSVWNMALIGDTNYFFTDQTGMPIDTGTYTYRKTSDTTGEFTFNSVGSIVGTCVVTFAAETTGRFTLSAPAASSTAEGTFTRM